MRNIKTIFLKELKDTLRDKRTLITMVVIPLLVFPLIFYIFTSVSKSFAEDAMKKPLKIGYVEQNLNDEMREQVSNAPLGTIEMIAIEDSSKFMESIRAEEIDIALYQLEDKNEVTTEINVYINKAEIEMKERIDMLFEYIQKLEQEKRLQELSLTSNDIEPVKFDYVDIASDEEKLGKIAGGILPYMFIIFCFIGCMYPAIDLFTGEKERGTIETILSTPVKRTELLFGKMGVVVLSGILAATLAVVGLFGAVNFIDLGEANAIKDIVFNIMTPQFIGTLYLLLIPLTVFFAGVMIPLSIYAKSFKEAQSIITPLNIVVILPAMIGFMPGIEYNLGMALIPILNIVLATKEIIAGTIEPVLLIVTFVELIAIAVIAVWISKFQYSKESNIL